MNRREIIQQRIACMDDNILFLEWCCHEKTEIMWNYFNEFNSMLAKQKDEWDRGRK